MPLRVAARVDSDSGFQARGELGLDAHVSRDLVWVGVNEKLGPGLRAQNGPNQPVGGLPV